MANYTKLFNPFVTDKRGNIVIGQRPNLPIIGWAVCVALAFIFKSGNIGHELAFLRGAFLFVWAYLEIVSGASYFRRTLGVVVMVFLLVQNLKF